MNDMTSVIQPKSDQLNADSLLGGPVVITISDVAIKPGTEQPVTISYEGDDGKPWKPCKSTSRCLVAAWGADARQYVGRSVKLFCDPNVTWGGMKVGGIRISHMSHIEREMLIALTATKGKKVMASIKPLVMEQAPAATSTAAPLDRATAEQDMRAATSLDDLKAVWTRKAMAPHRDALAGLLEECKSALVSDDQPGPDDSQRGETHTATATDEATAAEIIRLIGIEKVSDSLDALFARKREEIDGLPEDLQEIVRRAYYDRFEAVSPKGGA